MNIPTITMDPEAAQAKLVAYQNRIRRAVEVEYQAAIAGYQALAEGTPLLNLADAFTFAGLDDDGRPRLAVARADRKQVRFAARSSFLNFITLRNHDRFFWGGYQGSLVVSIPYEFPAGRRTPDGYALVPLVPADARPEKGQLSFYGAGQPLEITSSRYALVMPVTGAPAWAFWQPQRENE
ncbi:MAG: hypothetical protein L0332_23555, partial [Chloroflexi bacterium]|nr:hypothetical protein [Chloroflexota bacterium]